MDEMTHRKAHGGWSLTLLNISLLVHGWMVTRGSYFCSPISTDHITLYNPTDPCLGNPGAPQEPSWISSFCTSTGPWLDLPYFWMATGYQCDGVTPTTTSHCGNLHPLAITTQHSLCLSTVWTSIVEVTASNPLAPGLVF